MISDNFFTEHMTIVIAVAIVLLLIIILLTCWKRVPADKALVITGLKKRVLTGKGGIQVPFLETSCIISLEAVSMTTDITEAPSKQGIFVDIAGTAVVKVDNNPEKVLIAVEQFCSGNADRTTQNIKTVVEQILEGKLRGIVSTLTVEQINEDRVAFENSIEDSITRELDNMGLRLLSYTVLKIATQGGYLENRAIPQIAQSKADADIASAERARDTEVKTAAAVREGQKAKLEAEAEIAQSDRDKTIRMEQYRAEQDKIKANADVSYKLQEIENNKIVADRNVELAKKEAQVVEEQLVASVKKPADAKKYETEVQAKAEAEAIRAQGEAEAEALKAKGIAEAEAKDRLAEAMEKYGEAAMMSMVVERLPEIMAQIAKPMEQIDKITVIDNGSGDGGSKVSKIVSDVAANGFEVLKDLTGADLGEVVRTIANKNSNNKPKTK